MTRRELIWRAAQAGGYSAAFVLMRSMDLVASPEGPATPSSSHPTPAAARIAIIGAGVAGLIANANYADPGSTAPCSKRERVPERNWTIRRGDKVEFANGTVQQCAFDEGQYFNAGYRANSRDPSNDPRLLPRIGRPDGGAREQHARHIAAKRPRVRRQTFEQRQVINDTRGHVAELLAKAIRRGALDEEVTRADRERMLAFLQTCGDLSSEFCKVPAGQA